MEVEAGPPVAMESQYGGPVVTPPRALFARPTDRQASKGSERVSLGEAVSPVASAVLSVGAGSQRGGYDDGAAYAPHKPGSSASSPFGVPQDWAGSAHSGPVPGAGVGGLGDAEELQPSQLAPTRPASAEQLPEPMPAGTNRTLIGTFDQVAAAEAAPPDSHAVGLLDRLRQGWQARQASAVATPPRAKGPFMGDRGTLSAGATLDASGYPGSVSPRVPASPTPAIPSADFKDMGELSRQVRERDAEVRALRTEMQARQQEAAKLKNQVREAELSLHRASAVVGTWSAKVEAVSGSRHQLLEASAQKIDEHAGALRRRLGQLEHDLLQKDEELAILRKAVDGGTRRVEEQHQHIQGLQHAHGENERQIAALEQDFLRLQRQSIVADWQLQAHAQVVYEGHDHGSFEERQAKDEQIQAIEEEMATLRALITRCEERCSAAAKQCAPLQRSIEEVLRAHSAVEAAARLAEKKGKDNIAQMINEYRTIEARIEAEKERKAVSADAAKAYDAAQEELKKDQEQLTALIACSREVARMVHGPALGRLDASQQHGFTPSREANEMPEYLKASPPPFMAPFRIGASSQAFSPWGA